MARRTALLIGLLVAACSLALTPAPASAKGVHTTRFERRVLVLLNRARTHAGLRKLRFTGGLVRSARRHSRDMLASGTFDHGDFAARITRFYPSWQRIAENIAYGNGGDGSAKALVNAWLQSPGHRANILDPGFRVIGIGAALGTFDGLRRTRLLTADFAA